MFVVTCIICCDYISNPQVHALAASDPRGHIDRPATIAAYTCIHMFVVAVECLCDIPAGDAAVVVMDG